MIYVDRPILPTVNSLGTPFNKENKDSELNIRFASPGQSQASFASWLFRPACRRRLTTRVA
jgi:hypothetical protein